MLRGGALLSTPDNNDTANMPQQLLKLHESTNRWLNKCIFTKASWQTQTRNRPQVSRASQAVSPSLWRGAAGRDLLSVSDMLWPSHCFQGHLNRQVCSNLWHFQWATTLTRLPWVTTTQHWLIMQISSRQRTLLKLTWRTFYFIPLFFFGKCQLFKFSSFSCHKI